MHENQENLSPHIVRKVCLEFKQLQKEPIAGVDVMIDEQNVSQLVATVEGPQGTPFADGVFKVKICLTKDFPAHPPKGFFLTKIFHPNVGPNGEICVNTLKQDWNAKMGIRNVLLTIRCLLIHPNPESALNEEAGRLLLENYSVYEARARLMTEIYGSLNKPKTAQKPLTDRPSTSRAPDADTGASGDHSGATATKKRAVERLAEKKKRDKKRGLKRL